MDALAETIVQIQIVALDQDFDAGRHVNDRNPRTNIVVFIMGFLQTQDDFFRPVLRVVVATTLGSVIPFVQTVAKMAAVIMAYKRKMTVTSVKLKFFNRVSSIGNPASPDRSCETFAEFNRQLLFTENSFLLTI